MRTEIRGPCLTVPVIRAKVIKIATTSIPVTDQIGCGPANAGIRILKGQTMISHHDSSLTRVGLDGKTYKVYWHEAYVTDYGEFDVDRNEMTVIGGCCASDNLSVEDAVDLIELLTMFVNASKK